MYGKYRTVRKNPRPGSSRSRSSAMDETGDDGDQGISRSCYTKLTQYDIITSASRNTSM